MPHKSTNPIRQVVCLHSLKLSSNIPASLLTLYHNWYDILFLWNFEQRVVWQITQPSHHFRISMVAILNWAVVEFVFAIKEYAWCNSVTVDHDFILLGSFMRPRTTDIANNNVSSKLYDERDFDFTIVNFPYRVATFLLPCLLCITTDMIFCSCGILNRELCGKLPNQVICIVYGQVSEARWNNSLDNRNSHKTDSDIRCSGRVSMFRFIYDAIVES
jgi:hypothetical protein